MKAYSFEKLEAWQHARKLSVWTYNHLIISTDLLFLAETDYLEGRNLIEKQTYLISQLRRSQQNIKNK